MNQFAARRMSKTRNLAMTGMLAAVSTVLMFLDFSVPFMPGFIKMDFSELPALIASLAMGPWSGVAVCLIKNLINAIFTVTGGIGELSMFILGVCFVVPTGFLYENKRTRSRALIGSLLGAALMAAVGLFSNYYFVYPIYTNIMPMEAILGMYKVLYPGVQDLWQALVIFNVPFTFAKGLVSVVITFLIYKKISPIIKGKKEARREPVPVAVQEK